VAITAWMVVTAGRERIHPLRADQKILPLVVAVQR
jgi:hypothetical protein